MVTFFLTTSPLLLGYIILRHVISARWLANLNCVGPTYLSRKFWSSYEYLIQYLSEDSCAHLVVIQTLSNYVLY
jgi:hypothetical protein